MTHARAYIWIAALSALLLAACGKRPRGVENPEPAVYYWRTTLSLDSVERRFLREARVGKMYLHLFDVVRRDDGELTPSGTLLFADSVPQGVEIIPTVFIAPDALKGYGGGDLAQKILRRIDQMTEQNGCGVAKEVQMDYDWVSGDEQEYFQLLTELREMLHGQGRRLSATIRLHQLRKDVPPVDEGVLMVYNVGDFRSETEANSILTAEAVRPFLPQLGGYDLPLCAALPIYSWSLLFQQHEFRQIVRGVDLGDTTAWQRVDEIHYQCRAYMAAPANGVADEGGQRIYPGDMVRHEQPSPTLLSEVRDMLSEARPGVCDQIVLYHLDSKYLKDNYDETKELYNQR